MAYTLRRWRRKAEASDFTLSAALQEFQCSEEEIREAVSIIIFLL